MTEFGRLDTCYLVLVSQARPPNVDNVRRRVKLGEVTAVCSRGEGTSRL